MGRDALIIEALLYLISAKYNSEVDINIHLLDLLHRLEKEHKIILDKERQ
jgi:hypothetical protein